VIPLVLALAGCHVFETVTINCVSGMPCADTLSEDSGASDTGVTQDSAEPPPEPKVGFVVSMVKNDSDQQTKVQAYDPYGGNRSLWLSSTGLAGVVDYDSASGNGVVVGAEAAGWLFSGSPTPSEGPDVNGAEPVAVSLRNGIGYGVVRGGVVGLTVGSTEVEPLYTETQGTLVAAAAGPDGSLYLVRELGGFDLLQLLPSTTEPLLLHDDFARSSAQGSAVFAGPDGTPYVCSSAGETYAVEALAADVTTPAVVPSVALSDVRACAYDPGDDTWLAFSPTRGVYRFDRTGAVVNPIPGQEGNPIIPLPDAYVLLSGTFY
jgi:hypothetical protein